MFEVSESPIPKAVVAYTVYLYHRFVLSCRDVELQPDMRTSETHPDQRVLRMRERGRAERIKIFRGAV